MKIPVTLFLLLGITMAILIYFSYGEDPSETASFLTIPVVTEVLLIFIFFFSKKQTNYRKVFKIILILWSIVFVLAIVAWAYIVALGSAYRI